VFVAQPNLQQGLNSIANHKATIAVFFYGTKHPNGAEMVEI